MTPEIREAQLLTWQHTPNTAMAVTTDCGDANDIHPAHKQPVGARLALAARALAYGERLEYSGPVFDAMKIKGSGDPAPSAISAADWWRKDGRSKASPSPARTGVSSGQGRDRGKTLVVSSQAVPQPVAVRYGWADVPEGNLFNKAGLPASPFRTDVD